jgi:hypothetical protein
MAEITDTLTIPMTEQPASPAPFAKRPRRPSPPVGWNPAPCLVRPSLDYQFALDVCVARASSANERLGVVASSQFYERQLQARVGPAAVLLGTHPEPGSLVGPAPLSALIWAEPEADTASRTLAAVAALLATDGTLYVLSSGWLARRLPEWHGPAPRPARAPLGQAALDDLIRRHGFTRRVTVGSHGPRSIALGVLGQALDRLGRPDLADRFEARMRETYLQTGPLAALAPVRLTIARRASDAWRARRGRTGWP